MKNNPLLLAKQFIQAQNKSFAAQHLAPEKKYIIHGKNKVTNETWQGTETFIFEVVQETVANLNLQAIEKGLKIVYWYELASNNQNESRNNHG